ncbi:MAG TPA: VOC family protein [Candidatus Limnocylindrales bacterium]|nr:VOC family protein [Candidatus Limnocylindrales bacterium]
MTDAADGSSLLANAPVFAILLSTDLEASRRFYGETLGLTFIREDHFGTEERLVYQAGDGTRIVISKSTVGTSDTQTQCAFRVPDIRAAVAELRARGVRIMDYVAPAPVTDDGVADMRHSWAAWFIDPSGNCLAMVQPKG